MGAQWISGRVLDSRPKGCGFEPHRRHCVVSLGKNINPSLVLIHPRKTRPFINERLLMGRKESKQTNKLMRKIINQLHEILPAWGNGKNIVISTVGNNNIEPQAASENLNFFWDVQEVVWRGFGVFCGGLWRFHVP